MKKIFSCRRSSIALIGMILLAGIALIKGHDVSMAMSAIVLAVAGANAYESKKNEHKD
jgi:hypothetical protein